jgi:hypothetical protein
MLRQITWPQLMAWREYDRVEPLDSERYHAASITAGIANTLLAIARSKKRFRVKDFLVEFDEVKDAPSVEDSEAKANVARMKWIAMESVALANAEEKRKRR